VVLEIGWIQKDISIRPCPFLDDIYVEWRQRSYAIHSVAMTYVKRAQVGATRDHLTIGGSGR
jgi:hypothetical protein